MDDNELRKWNSELNKLERKLLDAIESRCRATESFQHKLKLAFKAVDFDEKGFGVETGSVSYTEFARALERFGFYPTGNEAIALRGLFERYNPDPTCPDLSYMTFIAGLYGDEKPWPPPPMRQVWECQTEQKEMLREAPTNNWANSTDELVPHDRPVRTLSLANEAHRMAKPPKWEGSPEKTHMKWSTVRGAVGSSKDFPLLS